MSYSPTGLAGLGADTAPGDGFVVREGLVFLPDSMRAQLAAFQQDAAASPAAVNQVPDTVRIGIYYGVEPPKTVTTVPTASAIKAAADQIAADPHPDAWVQMFDRTALSGAPGEYAIVFTRKPEVVASVAHVGGTKFLLPEQEASPTVVAARPLAAKQATEPAKKASSTGGKPLLYGLAVVALVGVGVLLFGGKPTTRRRRRYRGNERDPARCMFCKGAAHPATGAQYTPTAVACGPCVRDFWQWVRARQHKQWGGVRFADHILGPARRQP
jgi:hypothetical protein